MVAGRFIHLYRMKQHVAVILICWSWVYTVSFTARTFMKCWHLGEKQRVSRILSWTPLHLTWALLHFMHPSIFSPSIGWQFEDITDVTATMRPNMNHCNLSANMYQSDYDSKLLSFKSNQIIFYNMQHLYKWVIQLALVHLSHDVFPIGSLVKVTMN